MRHRFVVECGPEPVRATIDPERMRTVVANLVDNAMKCSPAGGLIHVTVSDLPEAGEVVVEVRDERMGIAAEDMPRLFTRFGRLVTAQNSHIAGTGLGLFLSRELTRPAS